MDVEQTLDAREAELSGDVVAPAGDDGHRILLEALVDVHALAALEGAVMASPRVRTLELQAYAGGWASLVVDVA